MLEVACSRLQDMHVKGCRYIGCRTGQDMHVKGCRYIGCRTGQGMHVKGCRTGHVLAGRACCRSKR